MDNAAFKLDTYHFVKASLNFDVFDDSPLSINIVPSGVYKQNLGLFVLSFNVKVSVADSSIDVVNVLCQAQFSFMDPIPASEIPDFFYPNSLAIIFPYIRAFVSTLTLQANVRPIVLPTVNLMGLTDMLRKETTVEE